MLLNAWRDLDKRLSEREQSLETEIAAHRGRPLVEAAFREVIDREDPARVVADTQVADAELVRDLHELLDVRLARERIASGSYGLCIACGGEIHPARLEAQPTALRCLCCQAQKEPCQWMPAARMPG